MSVTIAAVIVAAGSSTRMGEDKMLMKLGGKSVIRRTLEIFDKTPCISKIILVTSRENFGSIQPETDGIRKIQCILTGGRTRQESVMNGVSAATTCDFVAIHDGARPLVTVREIEQVCADAERYGAAALSTPVKDTIKVTDRYGFVVSTPDRSSLVAVATPQVFDRKRYIFAMEKAEAAGENYTDDCQLLESIGARVYMTEGKYTNIKITTKEDILSAEAMLGGIL